MRKIAAFVIISTLMAQPVLAVGLGDLAKVVLGGNSVLKKGQQKCGSSLALNSADLSVMDLARASVKKALPASQFITLDKAAETDATTQSQTVTFCDETKAKKKGLLDKIGNAGKAIGKVKGKLGGLGI